MFEEKLYFAWGHDSHNTRFVQCPDEVLAIPIDDAGRILLAVEPSPAFGQDVWVFPGGAVELGESPEATANRELREELGFAAGRLDYLGEVWPWSKYLSVRSRIYLARDLVKSPLNGDEDYEIRVVPVPFAEFDVFISDGHIRDARVISGLYLVRSFLQQHPL